MIRTEKGKRKGTENAQRDKPPGAKPLVQYLYIYIYKRIQNSAISSTAANQIVARREYGSGRPCKWSRSDVDCNFLIKVTRESSVTLTLQQQRRRPAGSDHHQQQQQQYRPTPYTHQACRPSCTQANRPLHACRSPDGPHHPRLCAFDV